MSTSTISNNSSRSKQSSFVNNKIIKLTNDLLNICYQSITSNDNQTVPKSIKSIYELNSNVFIFIFETICSTELASKKSPSETIDDEIHNIKVLINTISIEILHEDLSHLNAEAICDAIYSNKTDMKTKVDFISIEYLLDIFRCIHEWIASRLESISTPSQKSKEAIESQSAMETISEKIVQDENKDTIDEETLFEEYIKIKEHENDLDMLDSSFDSEINQSSIWHKHLEQFETFEKLYQEIETNYLSSSDLSTANTSAFSYRPSKKVVTFPDQLLDKPTVKTSRKYSRFNTDLKENKENEEKPKFVKLQNSYPPATFPTKSFIRPSLSAKSLATKAVNPVHKYHDYKKIWSKSKIPGENSHSNLRWWIREKMLEKPVIKQKPLSETKRQEWVD